MRNATTEEGLVKRRVDSYRVIKILNGTVIFAQPGAGDAAAVQRGGVIHGGGRVIRVESDRLVVILDSAGELTLLDVSVAAAREGVGTIVERGIGVVRIQLDRL